MSSRKNVTGVNKQAIPLEIRGRSGLNSGTFGIVGVDAVEDRLYPWTSWVVSMKKWMISSEDKCFQIILNVLIWILCQIHFQIIKQACGLRYNVNFHTRPFIYMYTPSQNSWVILEEEPWLSMYHEYKWVCIKTCYPVRYYACVKTWRQLGFLRHSEKHMEHFPNV